MARGGCGQRCDDAIDPDYTLGIRPGRIAPSGIICEFVTAAHTTNTLILILPAKNWRLWYNQ